MIAAKDVVARSNLAPDAPLVVLLCIHEARTAYTHDRDSLKFPFLKVIDPAA